METDHTYLQERAGHILEFDGAIRSAVLLTSDGKPLIKVERPGVAPLEPGDEIDTVYAKASIAIGMGAPMNKYYGRLRTIILIREKMTMICFSLTARIMLIVTGPDFQISRVEELGQFVDQLNLS
jgi:hypothetical protein